MQRILLVPAVAVVAFFFVTSSSLASDYGRFSGTPLVKLSPDGLTIELLETFSYTDPQARNWEVPAGYKSNGASIPSVLWSFIGGPLSGRFRDASIIHDYFCERKAHDWRVVHQNFYSGMRARGVDRRKAWVMFRAVSTFGPRWETKATVPKECNAGPDFNPELCVVNSRPQVVDATVELTPQRFDDFLRDLQSEGFGVEADALRQLSQKNNR